MKSCTVMSDINFTHNYKRLRYFSLSLSKFRIVSNSSVCLFDGSRCLVFIPCLAQQKRKESLWAVSPGCWTCTAALSKKVKSCQNICCVSHPDPSCPDRSVHLQPGQTLHYCAGGELRGWVGDKGVLRQSFCE